MPRNPLDVLTQQIVAMCAVGEWRVDDLYRLVRQAAPFATLTRGQLEGVLDMLSGRYPADELAELRPRITWDRLKGTIRAREGLQRLVVANAGTIPDRGLYGVFLADGAARPGAELRGGRPMAPARPRLRCPHGAGAPAGASASLTRRWSSRAARATSWCSGRPPGGSSRSPATVCWSSGPRRAGPDAVLARRPGQPPGRAWRGDRAADPRADRAAEAGGPQRTLIERHSLEPGAADNLLAYLDDQRAAIDAVPDDRTIVSSGRRDELGDWRLCLLSPWGGRVHAPWALALQAKLPGFGRRPRSGDDLERRRHRGAACRIGARPRTPACCCPDPDEIEDLVVRELGGSALFAAHFREAAGRALLIPRHRPGQRAPLWMQRKRAADLLAVAARFGSFPIVLETFRECLQDVFDLPALVELARRLRRRELRVVTVDAEAPSPFAASLLFGYVAELHLRRRRPAGRAAGPGAGRGPGPASGATGRRRASRAAGRPGAGEPGAVAAGADAGPQGALA